MNYYTYIHYDNHKRPFYVGKGRESRARQTAGRNSDWQKVADNGFTVEIIAGWPTEREAFAHEVFLISTLRALGFVLVNRTPGGGGVTGVLYTLARRQQMAQTAKRVFSAPVLRAKMSLAQKGRRRKQPPSVAVVCKTTGDVFASAKDAALWLRSKIVCKACPATVLKAASNNAKYRGFAFALAKT